MPLPEHTTGAVLSHLLSRGNFQNLALDTSGHSCSLNQVPYSRSAAVSVWGISWAHSHPRTPSPGKMYLSAFLCYDPVQAQSQNPLMGLLPQTYLWASLAPPATPVAAHPLTPPWPQGITQVHCFITNTEALLHTASHCSPGLPRSPGRLLVTSARPTSQHVAQRWSAIYGT